jgi:hypothetical protein
MGHHHRRASRVEVENAANAHALEIMRKASWVVVGGYAVATLYKLGVVARLLPSGLNKKLEKTVEAIKRRTQPLTNTKRFTMARSCLSQTYLVSSFAFACSGLGVFAFFENPSLPIGLPIAISAVSSAVLWVCPKSWVIPAGRLGLTAAGSVATGYCFGPLHWVAYDSIFMYNAVVASSAIGFTLPLFLTRGMVAYFLSAQLLSLSLAVACSSLLGSTDVNVALTLQIISNFALCAIHTIPTVRKYIEAESDEKLGAEEDAVGDGFKVFAGVQYGIFQLFRSGSTAVLAALTSSDRKGVTKEERQQLRTFADLSVWHARCSNVIATSLFLVVYVKAVSYIQRSGARTQLEDARWLFRRLSPLSLVS